MIGHAKAQRREVILAAVVIFDERLYLSVVSVESIRFL